MSRGLIATREGLDAAMIGSAVLLGAVALSIGPLPLRPATGQVNVVDVSTTLSVPTLVFEPTRDDGPVLVTVRYHVLADSINDFVTAMSAVRRSRLRTGGQTRRLYQSVEEPNTFLEKFTVASWTEFERQRTERWLAYDSEGTAKALSYTVDQSRRLAYYLEKRVPR